MASILRRAGSKLILLILRHSADPAGVVGEVSLFGASPQDLYSKSGNGVRQKLTGVRSILPTSWMDGAQLSWTSTSVVTIASGFVRADDDTIDLYLAASQAVDITVSGVNGLDAGVEAASTWYAVYIIGDSNGVSPVAGILSTNFVTPTFPAGYDRARRIGVVRNSAGSNFLKFNQVWNTQTRRYWYDEDRATLQVLTNGAQLAFTAVDLSSRVPLTGLNVVLAATFLAPAAVGAVTDLLTLRPTGANSADGPYVFRVGALQTASGMTDIEMPCSASQSIDYKVTDADDVANLFVLGFDDDL